MIPAQLFGTHVTAHLHYAAGQPPVDAERILRSRLEDGSWVGAANQWISLASKVDQGTQKRGSQDGLIATLVQQLLERRLDDPLQEHLPPLLAELVDSPATAETVGSLLESVTAWVLRASKAGDAKFVADVLDVAARRLSTVEDLLALYRQHPLRDKRFSDAWDFLQHLESGEERRQQDPDDAQSRRKAELLRRAGLLRPFAPLARWMLEKGPAELRRPERGGLLGIVLECLIDHASSSELQLSLRYLSLNPESGKALSFQHSSVFWAAAERVLAEQGTEELVCELVATMYRGNWFAEHSLIPLLGVHELPRARRTLLQGLSRGRFSLLAPRFHKVAWASVFRHGPDLADGLHGALAETLMTALEALKVEPLRQEAPHALEHWAEYLAREWMRIHGLDSAHLAPLLTLAERPELSAPVAKAVHLALGKVSQDAPPEVGLALHIFQDCGETLEALRAVFSLTLQRPRAELPRAARLERLLEEFRRIVNLPWSSPVFGVDLSQMLQGVRDVSFERLEKNDLVQFRDGTLLLHEPHYQDMAGKIVDEEEFLATSTLYFLHELAHVRQGIGSKEQVEFLRETGGEATLMHLDLSADHAAALLTQLAVPRWSLTWLKDVQGRSLLEYRVSRGHTAASRGRKTTRLISLRLDYLARVATAPPAWRPGMGGGYVFADLSPGSGAMLILISGPPVSVVGTTRLSAEDTALLTGAMDEREDTVERLPKIDALLARQFRLR
jgi:hypothetical protein